MQSPSPSSKVEVVKQAIKQVLEEVGVRGRDGRKSSSDDDDGDFEGDNHHRLLSKLMSQLEMSEAEPEPDPPCPVVSKSDYEAKSNVSRFEEEEEEERIVKELKKLKRQNLITHCLLSVMIVLTIAWQISEVSFLLKLKDGVNHPFRSIGGFLKGLLRPRQTNGNEEDTDSKVTSNLIETTPMHDIKIPEFSVHQNRLGL